MGNESIYWDGLKQLRNKLFPRFCVLRTTLPGSSPHIPGHRMFLGRYFKILGIYQPEALTKKSPPKTGALPARDRAKGGGGEGGGGDGGVPSTCITVETWY